MVALQKWEEKSGIHISDFSRYLVESTFQHLCFLFLRATVGLPWQAKLASPVGFCHISKVAQKPPLLAMEKARLTWPHPVLLENHALWLASPCLQCRLARPQPKNQELGTYCLCPLSARHGELSFNFLLLLNCLNALASNFLHIRLK